MKCLCGYEYILEIDGETDEVITTMGDEDFIFLGSVTGMNNVTSEPRHYNEYACPKCGTVKIEV